MTLALKILAVPALIFAVRGVWQGRERLRHTTLVPAGRWALAASLLWAVTLGLVLSNVIPGPQQDALWYATALMSLCPAIAVLGARRPGAGVWNAFVIVPLLAVLGWPLLTLWTGAGEFRALRLETPQLIGFVLVLLMGAGNYIGTRFSLPAAAYVVSLCLLVGSVSAVAPLQIQASQNARYLATLCLGLAVVVARGLLRAHHAQHPDEAVRSAAREAAPSDRAASEFDRLWSDYRDTFGIVWSKRFQERLNGIARQQKWPARLTDAGIQWEPREDSDMNRDQTLERIDQTFRWLLRRFVDPPWIAARLDRPTGSGETSPDCSSGPPVP